MSWWKEVGGCLTWLGIFVGVPLLVWVLYEQGFNVIAGILSAAILAAVIIFVVGVMFSRDLP